MLHHLKELPAVASSCMLGNKIDLILVTEYNYKKLEKNLLARKETEGHIVVREENQTTKIVSLPIGC